MKSSVHLLLFVAAISVSVRPVQAVVISAVSPAYCQAVPLAEGTPCYTQGTGPIAAIPPALAGGVLVRTSQSDSSNSAFSLRFNGNERAEVWVCYERGATLPAWLSSWIATDMIIRAGTQDYCVYARRFAAGQVVLGANAASTMYFVVVKSSVPVLPRVGWVLLSYDMPYLYDIIKHAPEYHVNHIQLSHDIIMFAQDALLEPSRRSDINELIDWAHAYGIPEVTLWTHEVATRGMPSWCYSGSRVDGDNPEMWQWMQSQYSQLFAAGTGCPAVDGIILTFDELSMFYDGVEVYDRNLFKHDNHTPTESLAMVINKMQAVCSDSGKSFYVRTWGGQWQDEMRDAIQLNGDPAVWMMNKNVGDVNGVNVDWLFMDSYNPLIGTLPAQYHEMIEFDICGEYLGRGRYTFCMTSYLKQHWQRAVGLGADGAAARIDRGGSLPYYTANRLNLFAFGEVVFNPAADPASLNLTWCSRQFPAEAAQDVANHYDAPGSAWEGDTRYLTWETFCPDLSPTTTTQARGIGTSAIALLDQHRAALEAQSTLDTRDGRSDYDVLRNGVAVAVLDLGGSLPTVYGFSSFAPKTTTELRPNCTIRVQAASPGLRLSSITCDYSVNGGTNWTSWPTTCTGSNGSLAAETITATSVPFNQVSETLNCIRFHAETTTGVKYDSGLLKVAIIPGLAWGPFRPTVTSMTSPVCALSFLAGDVSVDWNTARWCMSTDEGATWPVPGVTWSGVYDGSKVPSSPTWYFVEGVASYATSNGGLLRVYDTGTSGGNKLKYATNWSVASGVGATVLARMRCASGGHWLAGNIWVSDGQHNESLYLKASGVAGLASCGAVAPVDTTQWHLYRVTIRNNDIMVYCDEKPDPLISATGSFLLGSGEQRLIIGSGSSEGTQDVYYDYVYWTTAGAFPPDAWQSAGLIHTPAGGTLFATAPFNQQSETLNKVRFSIKDTGGHTLTSPTYTVPIRASATWADLDCDGDVDQEDFAVLQGCVHEEGLAPQPGCQVADYDQDGDVDMLDMIRFENCMNGPNTSPRCP